MKIQLPYGRCGHTVDVPAKNLLAVLKPKGLKADKSPDEMIRHALKYPKGTETLSKILAKKTKKDSVVIVVDDHTRPCPTHLMMIPILDELCAAGIKDEQITILFASGSHRTTKPEEAEQLLGAEVASRIKYISNESWGEDFVDVGTTKKGTSVLVKKAYMDADVKILTGDVEIHYFAGFGGGRKSILPGIVKYSTIQDNYKRNFFDPNSQPAKLDGNPMYENMTEAAQLAGVDFTLNVVQDDHGVVGAFAGDFDVVLRKGAELVEKIYKAEAPEKADIIITSANGAPHDIDLYQAYKALHLALNVVKDKGVIILVAECPEAAGNKNYDEWMRKYKTKEEMKAELEKEFNIGGHKAYYNHLAAERVTLFLVSAMPKDDVENVFKFQHAATPQEALDAAFHLKGKDATVIIAPEGSTTLLGIRKK